MGVFFSRWLWVFVAALALGACGSEEEESPFPLEVESESGAYRATLSPLSEPLVVGRNDFELRVFRVAEGGAPVEGLEIEVEPWMPHHGHGSPSEPTVEEMGEGRYRIRSVDFSMEGEWELRILLTQGENQDRIVAAFRI